MGFGETESGARPAQLGDLQRRNESAGGGPEGQRAVAVCAGIVIRHGVGKRLVSVLRLGQRTGQPSSITAPQPVCAGGYIHCKRGIGIGGDDSLGFRETQGDIGTAQLGHGQRRGHITRCCGEGQGSNAGGPGVVSRHDVGEGLAPVLVRRLASRQPVRIAAPQPVCVRSHVHTEGRFSVEISNQLSLGNAESVWSQAAKLGHTYGRSDITSRGRERQLTDTIRASCICFYCVRELVDQVVVGPHGQEKIVARAGRASLDKGVTDS